MRDRESRDARSLMSSSEKIDCNHLNDSNALELIHMFILYAVKFFYINFATEIEANLMYSLIKYVRFAVRLHLF